MMLSKSESVADFDALTELDVIALCETARGVLAATSLAALDCVVALMWGAEDLVPRSAEPRRASMMVRTGALRFMRGRRCC